MNWITKIIKAGEKIKSAIHKRASKEDIANSDWTSCCKGPILKKDLENSKLDLVVAGTKDAVLMVESEASGLTDNKCWML